MCRAPAKQRAVLITIVKGGWNITGSLTCDGRTNFFLYLALVAILFSEAKRAGEVHNYGTDNHCKVWLKSNQ
jgi:hypothetical protein